MKTGFWFLLILLSLRGFSQQAISFQMAGGVQMNIPSQLRIMQSGYDNLIIKKARYEARPLRLPPYWDIGISYLEGKNGFGVRISHYKIILTNKPVEITKFSVSHGYNAIMFIYQRSFDHFYVSPGLGVALAHPESEIRGQKFDQKDGLLGKGYYLTGPVFYGTVGKKFRLLENLSFFGESRIAAGYADVLVANGNAIFWHWSIVLHGGLVFDLGLNPK